MRFGFAATMLIACASIGGTGGDSMPTLPEPERDRPLPSATIGQCGAATGVDALLRMRKKNARRKRRR